MKAKRKKGKFLETVESIGVALLIAMAVRAFLIEPFKIPSPSMVPTLLIGDQIFVNKFVYGLRVPFSKKRVWDGRDPERGEVMVFMYPEDESLDFIKRVVGVPGDTVRVEGNQVYVNGEPVERTAVRFSPNTNHDDRVSADPAEPYAKMTLFPGWERFEVYSENLDERKHWVQYEMGYFMGNEWTVPEGHYFVMGDNRDHSDDSRRWGFVPRENVKGRAMFIWLSFDWNRPFYQWVRWHRFGRPIR